MKPKPLDFPVALSVMIMLSVSHLVELSTSNKFLIYTLFLTILKLQLLVFSNFLVATKPVPSSFLINFKLLLKLLV